MGIFNIYPYTDFHELNADWIIKIVKELESELKDFVKLNTIKYSDPIGWNITNQYEANTVVVNPATGNAYISSKPVPNGVIITNTNYWTEIYNYQRTIEKIESSIASYNGSEYAQKAYLKDSLIFYKDLLYKASENISVGSRLLPDTNIHLITIEDVINTTKSDLQDVINTTKSDLQDVITTESNERKATDETINNNITLLDTDLTNVKNEVNSHYEELLDEIVNRENADSEIIKDLDNKYMEKKAPFTKYYANQLLPSFCYIKDDGTIRSDLLLTLDEIKETIRQTVNSGVTNFCLPIQCCYYNGIYYRPVTNDYLDSIMTYAESIGSKISFVKIHDNTSIDNINDTWNTLYQNMIKELSIIARNHNVKYFTVMNERADIYNNSTYSNYVINAMQTIKNVNILTGVTGNGNISTNILNIADYNFQNIYPVVSYNEFLQTDDVYDTLYKNAKIILNYRSSNSTKKLFVSEIGVKPYYEYLYRPALYSPKDYWHYNERQYRLYFWNVFKFINDSDIDGFCDFYAHGLPEVPLLDDVRKFWLNGGITNVIL